MPVLDAARIDYSLLAGAESLRARRVADSNSSEAYKLHNNSTPPDDSTAYASTEASSSSHGTSTPASSAPNSDDEDEHAKRTEVQAKQALEDSSKYTFRTPKKVSQVCQSDTLCSFGLLWHLQADIPRSGPVILTLKGSEWLALDAWWRTSSLET